MANGDALLYLNPAKALAQKCPAAQGVNGQAWEKEIAARVAAPPAPHGIDLADLDKNLAPASS